MFSLNLDPAGCLLFSVLRSSRADPLFEFPLFMRMLKLNCKAMIFVAFSGYPQLWITLFVTRFVFFSKNPGA